MPPPCRLEAAVLCHGQSSSAWKWRKKTSEVSLCKHSDWQLFIWVTICHQKITETPLEGGKQYVKNQHFHPFNSLFFLASSAIPTQLYFIFYYTTIISGPLLWIVVPRIPKFYFLVRNGYYSSVSGIISRHGKQYFSGILLLSSLLFKRFISLTRFLILLLWYIQPVVTLLHAKEYKPPESNCYRDGSVQRWKGYRARPTIQMDKRWTVKYPKCRSGVKRGSCTGCNTNVSEKKID